MKLVSALFLAFIVSMAGQAQAAQAKDVLGREVPMGEGRPALVLYTNQDTRDAVWENAFDFVYGLRDEKPIVVVRVDLRDVPGMFRGMAKGEIRKAHKEAVAAMTKMFRDKGEPVPAEIDRSLYMVSDGKGAPHEAVGLKKGFDEAFGQAVSASGKELASGPFPKAAKSLENALEKDHSVRLSAR